MKPEACLIDATKAFFALYWCKNNISCTPPEWNEWKLNGIPSEARLGGCYAIYKETELMYIGVAVTEGKNAEQNGKKYGLIDRLKRHVISRESRKSTQFVPHKTYADKWNGMTSIWLIGFPDEHRHLAAALEVYLIKRLAPKINAQTRWGQPA